jgi:putative ABC transport system ATP-binding protein
MPGRPDQEAGTMALVEMKGIDKTYRTGTQETRVLRGLDLVAERGEMIMIMGPSGSGKTTLLNLIGGIDPDFEGSMVVGGQDLRGLSARDLSRFRREKVGFIFQFYNLIPTLTARENVELGLETTMKDRKAMAGKAKEYLDLVGIVDKSDNFPQELSGGEQQRVAIARALSKEPMLILADEPTGNLDEEREGSVMKLMQRLQHELGMTFFIVSHNPRLQQYVDRTLVLRHGKVTDKKEQG